MIKKILTFIGVFGLTFGIGSVGAMEREMIGLTQGLIQIAVSLFCMFIGVRAYEYYHGF